jgi:transcriptional regulator with XRE-family HTH domain
LRVRLAAGMIADGDDPPGMWMAPANLDATQCKMARAALGIGVPELAARAVVSPDTVFRLEKGERLHQRTIIAIREALEAAGVEFINENGGRPGVRLKPK